jgi:hypothetical protein
VFMKEGKLAHARFAPWENDVRDALVLVKEGKLACTSFPQHWNDVSLDARVLV